MTCDHEGCEATARWAVYVVANLSSPTFAPMAAMRPEPLIRVCGDHLTWELGRDAASVGSTQQWVVKPV